MSMNQIQDRLWLGSWQDAAKLERSTDFTVVTCAADSKCRGKFFFPITDPGTAPEDRSLFNQAVACVIDLLGKKESVLVHCVSGVNRSVAVVVAVLMKLNNLSLTEAFNLVKTARHHVNPCDQQLLFACNVAGFFPGRIDRSGFVQFALTEHETIVDNLYQEILCRKADADGLTHYAEEIAVGRMNRESLRTCLINSAEYKMKMVNFK